MTHSETLENIKNLLQGQRPGVLSPRGIGQAEKVALYLKDRRINNIYTSGMERCAKAGEIIAVYHPDSVVAKNNNLNARCLGIFEGMKKDEAPWDDLNGGFFANRPDGGETLEETWDRINSFYDGVKNAPEESTLLIIAHGETAVLLGGIVHGYDLPTAYEKIPEPKKAEFSEYEICRGERAKTIKTNFGEHLL